MIFKSLLFVNASLSIVNKYRKFKSFLKSSHFFFNLLYGFESFLIIIPVCSLNSFIQYLVNSSSIPPKLSSLTVLII